MKINHGVLYSVRNTDINKDGSFIVPNGITSIGEEAFQNCASLTSVAISNGVKSIEKYAFCRCSGLTSVSIPTSITNIGGDAFYGCSSLTSVSVSASVTKIGYGAFSLTRLESKTNNYKAFSLTKTGKLKCLDRTYTVGEKSMIRGDLELCENGIHYCTNIFDIFAYYYGEYGNDFVIGVCDVSDKNIGGANNSKRCAKWIIPTRILTREEVIKIMNGDKNDEG